MDCLYTQRQKYRFLSGLFGTMVVKKQLKPNLDIYELLSEKQLEKPNYRCALLLSESICNVNLSANFQGKGSKAWLMLTVLE